MYPGPIRNQAFDIFEFVLVNSFKITYTVTCTLSVTVTLSVTEAGKVSWDLLYEWQPSADHTTSIMGAGEIGGIPELVYKPIRFKEYTCEPYNLQTWIKPKIADSDSFMTELDADDDYEFFTGKTIFCALYNLGKYLNDERVDIGDPVERIVEFCTEYVHPYFVDELDDLIEQGGFGAYSMLEKQAAFRANQFLQDLGRLYNAASFYFALEDVKRKKPAAALHLAEDGRFFDGLPFFERYLHPIPEVEWNTDDASDAFDIVQEMQREQPVPGKIPRLFYKEMTGKLADIMPDFRVRVKVEPRTERMVLAADVNSVFDIAWFVLARLITSGGQRVKQETSAEGTPKELAVVICPNCGEAFARRSNRQQFCTKEECRKAHNAQRQKKYRENKTLNDLE